MTKRTKRPKVRQLPYVFFPNIPPISVLIRHKVFLEISTGCPWRFSTSAMIWLASGIEASFFREDDMINEDTLVGNLDQD